MTNKQKPKDSNFLWRLFSSVRLTLVLLILLAAASIIGTLVPQGRGAVEFARQLSPGMLKVFTGLQLFDVYHSWWFRILVAGLALNLVVCSLNRLPSTLKLFGKPPRPDPEKPFQDVPEERRLLVPPPLTRAAEEVHRWVSKRYQRTQRKDGSGSVWFCGEKGRYSLFSLYLVHASVIVILAGAMVGSIWGFEAFVNIPEGEAVDAVRLRGSGELKDLGFEIRCADFSVKFYEDGTPKEYRSELRIKADGETLDRSLRVNHPLTFRGIKFYQSSYGTIPGDEARIAVNPGNGREEVGQVVRQGRPYPLPGGEGAFLVDEIRDDFMRMGPAVKVSVRPEKGGPVSFWLFKNTRQVEARFPGIFEKFPKLNPSAFEPYTFRLEHIESRYYTGLQVNRDPGVPLVWAGFFMIVTGLMATFFLSHQRVWIRLEETETGVLVQAAARSNKNPVGLERELDRSMAGLKERLGARREK